MTNPHTGSVTKADFVKPKLDEVKIRWAELLSKYFESNGIVKEEFCFYTDCVACGHDGIASSFNLNGFHHHKCAKCETVYVSPRLTDSCIEELYSDEYYNEMFSRSMLPVFDRRKATIGQSKYQQTVGHWGKSHAGSVLDVGAGIGEVPDVFKDNNWETSVIEMNPVAHDWLVDRGHVDVFKGSLENYSRTKPFDVIMAWGVVEHVIDPEAFLKKVVSLMADDGLFVSEVPNGLSLLVNYCSNTGTDPERILMGEQHIVLYSPSAYIDLHEKCGLERVHVQTNGLDVSTVLGQEQLDQEKVIQMQRCIDQMMYGDLLRGFWRKKRS